MKIKQHTPEQPVGQERYQKRNENYLETNKNENTTYQNLWDKAKGAVRQKIIAINTLRKKQSSQVNNLTLYLKEVEDNIILNSEKLKSFPLRSEIRQESQRDICTLILIAALFTIDKIWKQTKYPLRDERIKKMLYKNIFILFSH